MRLLTPLEPRPTAPLARANPLAKIAAALVVMVTLFASLDAVTASVVLAVLLALVPVSGLAPRALLGRSWLIVVTAVGIGVVNVLFAPAHSGAAIDVGPLRIGSDTAIDGAGLSLRLLAIGLAGLLATATSQPIDIADALVQQLRVSPRVAIGSLAAIRMLPALAHDWQTASLARRARGVEIGWSPVAVVRFAGGILLALLVSSVRRGTRLSRAMEARGLGSGGCRTVARVQRMRSGDWAWIAGSLLLATAAIGLSLALGTWRPLIG